MTVIQEEMDKFASLEPTSMEFNLTRNYLDWLTVLPWGINKKENFDIVRAEKVLNDEHYGLQDVKERILGVFLMDCSVMGAVPSTLSLLSFLVF